MILKPNTTETSLLNQDLYQLSMAQLVHARFAANPVEYKFTCRNAEKIQFFHYVSQEDLEDLKGFLSGISLNEDEYKWLASRGYFSEEFLDWLRLFRFEPERHLKITSLPNRGWDLRIRGSWLQTIFYEIFCLSFLNQRFSENYCRQNKDTKDVWLVGAEKLDTKINLLKSYNSSLAVEDYPKILEFGTRRRLSGLFQEYVLDNLLKRVPNNIIGTSNVLLAKTRGIKELGTFSHQFPMALQGLVPIQSSQSVAFSIWQDFYKGQWGIALSDTLGNNRFIKDFTLGFAHGFTGVRHDSGDPFEYGELIIKMYKGYKIDPLTKNLVFSDGLDIPLAIELHKKLHKRIKVSFGIGTNLTNDCGIPTPAIVIKIVSSNNQDVCKLSANPAKASCNNQQYLDYVRMAIERY